MAIVLVGDRYQITRRLGKGGMSRVYLAWDSRLRMWGALKVMSREAVSDEVLRNRFAQEARVMARLSHPHLIRLFDLRDDVETPYMAMEYMEGGTVARRLTRGPLHPQQALTIAAQLCSALGAAHDAGIVHRDVKPQNLLLDRVGHMKLADFGVAQAAGDTRMTMSNMSLGTLAYMPPEQQRDASKVDHRADIYGAGATLFAMLTARRPTALVAADRDRALDGLPEATRDLVTTATAADPGDRYATAAAFEAALRDALNRVERTELDATSLIVTTDPVPTGPPRTGDTDDDLDDDDFGGTTRRWRPVTRPPESSSPSMIKTMLIDEEDSNQPSSPAVASFDRPAPTPTPAVRTRRWPTVLAVVVLVAGLVSCAGLCAGGALGGLGGIGWGMM
ncbi:MAG: serine/threonine protein kinase [Alphaproteobacteria bacterium]|nr:serine/threonine protein kinase [Alphaproteobacteria bacterium]